MQKLLIFILLSFFIVNCQRKTSDLPQPVTQNPEQNNPGDDTTNLPEVLPKPEEVYVEAEKRSFYSKESLKLVSAALGYGDLSSKIKNSAQAYLVKYKTNYKGQEILASGMLYVPDSADTNTPILSFQHGTTFKKADAPSTSPNQEAVLLSATGYITLVPDYIGYGSSAEIFHPYYIKRYAAGAVIDLIKAGKHFLSSNGFQYKNSVFLAGYSEGGYVSIAAQEEIEKNHPEIKLAAVAAGAGGFNLKDMLNDLTTQSNYPNPGYLAFILNSFDISNNWNKGPGYFFGPLYENKFPQLLDGKNSSSYINGQLTTNLEDLLDKDFYQNLKDGKEEQFRDEIEKNSCAVWLVKSPLKIYHGTKDEVVPYTNSLDYFNKLSSQGGNNIHFVTIPNGSHGSSFKPMAIDFLEWFDTLK